MVALLVLAGILLLVLGIAVYASRAIVRWPTPPTTPIITISRDRVTLPATPLTRYAGSYSLRSASGHARVGAILDSSSATVTREVLSSHGDILTASRATFEGDLFLGPDELGVYSNVAIPTTVGLAPAWQFSEGADSSLWIIHIHGYQANRLNALRTVAALQSVPATHLVVSYRGDGDGPKTPGNTSRLGMDEWCDVESALEYAVDHGAKRVVLVGWSMGAGMALRAEELGSHRDRIVGNVFVSPALDWRAIITTSARRMAVPAPKAITVLCVLLLSTPGLCRLAGLKKSIDFGALDWTRSQRVHVPTLVMHSSGDLTSPLEASRRFRDANDAFVDLVELERAAHTREYNVDPQAFGTAASMWVKALLS